MDQEVSRGRDTRRASGGDEEREEPRARGRSRRGVCFDARIAHSATVVRSDAARDRPRRSGDATSRSYRELRDDETTKRSPRPRRRVRRRRLGRGDGVGSREVDASSCASPSANRRLPSTRGDMFAARRKKKTRCADRHSEAQRRTGRRSENRTQRKKTRQEPTRVSCCRSASQASVTPRASIWCA